MGGLAPPSSVYGTEVLLLNYAGTNDWRARVDLHHRMTVLRTAAFAASPRARILVAGLRVARSLRVYEAREATAPTLPQSFPSFGGRGGYCPRNARRFRAARLAAGCGHLFIRVSSESFDWSRGRESNPHFSLTKTADCRCPTSAWRLCYFPEGRASPFFSSAVCPLPFAVCWIGVTDRSRTG